MCRKEGDGTPHYVNPFKNNKNMTLVKKISKVEFGKSVELAKKNPANGLRYNPTSSKYVMISGIPHKWSNGSLVSLTKLSK